MNRSSLGARACLLATFGALAGGVLLAQVPGVGYDPAARGQLYSRFKLDSLNNGYQSHRMDFGADPGAVGQVVNPYYFNFGDPVVRAAYEARYGAATAGPRFKSWIGPNNEVRGVVREALVWWFANRAGELGGSAAGRNGQPTEVEVTDVQATGDSAIWVGFLQATQDGFTPDRRRKINDPSKPPGDSEAVDSFWGITVYYHNTFRGYYPFSPQVPIPPEQ